MGGWVQGGGWVVGSREVGGWLGPGRWVGGMGPPPLWDTDACARPVPFGTKQKCNATREKLFSDMSQAPFAAVNKMAHGAQLFSAPKVPLGGWGGTPPPPPQWCRVVKRCPREGGLPVAAAGTAGPLQWQPAPSTRHSGAGRGPCGGGAGQPVAAGHKVWFA